jgi:hypothetical protein
VIPIALSFLTGGISRAIAFLRSLPWYAIVICLLALASAFLWQRGNHLTKERNHARGEAVAARQAHNDDIRGWAAAQKRAEDAQKANLARVVKQQKDISDETLVAYRADADSWRARFAQLRAAKDQRAPGATGLPATGQATGGTTEANSDPGGFVAVQIDALEATVAAAIQGKAIQDWVLAQEAVATSPR